MDAEKVKAASNILDYWFAIEFLGQDSYELCTNAMENRRKTDRYKKSLSDEKNNKRKQISTFLEVAKDQSLYDAIKKECVECQMGTWGNITVYLGKIKRELCIENIAKYLKADEKDRPEKSYDDIAVASFQMNARGEYIDHTFSLSTIIWAVNRMQNISGGQLSDCLSVQLYQEDIDGLEKIFWNRESNTQPSQYETLSSEICTNHMPGFSEEAMTMEKLAAIYTEIKKQYVDRLIVKAPEGEMEGTEVYGFSFQLFKDEQARETFEEDNYLGLSHDYFSNDLKMLKELLNVDNFNMTGGMASRLVDYINAPYYENMQRDRFDLIQVKDPDELEFWLHQALNMRKAPIGKWPSRYMPALMQQVAVNYATEGKSGDIFSVNGPPGTGKTTLLKEIVANHIVEKTKKLSIYDDPDDAFEKHSFLHGAKQHGGYSKFLPYWYSLKDDGINDYSLLVASCNNTAVENITKELPLESGILKTLETKPEDSAAMKEQLEEVRALFSPGQCKEDEIYFTSYAQNLFAPLDAWGLVAAPLGKKSNIKSFYYQVLNPMHWKFYRDNQFKETRRDAYIKARTTFQCQLEKVEQLQDELARLGDIALHTKQAEETQKADDAQHQVIDSSTKLLLEDICKTKGMLANEIDDLRNCLEHAKEIEKEKAAALENRIQEFAENKNAVIEAQENALSATATINFRVRIFNKKRRQDAENLADSYRRQASEFQIKVKESEEQIIRAKAESKAAGDTCSAVEAKLKGKESKLEQMMQHEKECHNQVEESWKKCTESRKQAAIMREKYEAAMKAFQSQSDTQRGRVLDSSFVSELLSKDDPTSTRAQTTNLWATEHYNREREKLVYDALQLTREFILNSRCCRDNFRLLGQYWGLEANEDKERVLFHRSDRENMVGALYQTLFLLVPVISSTFASVGNLLRDVKTPGAIGTLVVDEAGQAQPQMAVGALYRSRRAIIVGDPKQVEPVVTDDLNLLKQSYKEDIYRYYQDKALSVQKCADILNPIGTYLANGTDYPDWVGCPLLVHRRCISPMYEISNEISYGGIMKQQTVPPNAEKQKTFVYEKSQWINTSGVEHGGKDHYVKQQGDKVCEMLEIAFETCKSPNLYIISPFKSVVRGVRKSIKSYCQQNRESAINRSEKSEDWMQDNIGTVHTFQGKEAAEVIFLLGCDGSKAAEGAVRWVNSNIVNVAVTRAQYRLYVIGDARVWESNPNISKMKAILDTFALKEIDTLQKSELDEVKKQAGYKHAVKQIPSVSAFPVDVTVSESGEMEYSIETNGFISNLDQMDFLERSFRDDQLLEFGFTSCEELDRLPNDIKRNIAFGMKLYYLLEPVYELDHNLDASCCAILFCKALELQLKENFVGGLKKQFGEYEIRGSRRMVKLKDADDRDLMIGTIHHILCKKEAEIGRLMQMAGEGTLDLNWWKAFGKKLNQCLKKRNQCCHAQWFQWKDMMELIHYEFGRDMKQDQGCLELGGVFFESAAGKKL